MSPKRSRETSAVSHAGSCTPWDGITEVALSGVEGCTAAEVRLPRYTSVRAPSWADVARVLVARAGPARRGGREPAGAVEALGPTKAVTKVN